MDTARYVVALLLLIGLPPGLLLWLAIHPFASFWRRLGPAWTYGVLSVPMGLLMWGVYRMRDRLLAVDYGTRYELMFLAAASVVVGSTIAVLRWKHLTPGVLAGLPELSPDRYPGKLLTQGIYSRIRHPRYMELLFWVLGYALFANYPATYVLSALIAPVLYLVVLLEERELRDRFGSQYEEYCRAVPRFFPRFRGRP